MFCNKYLYKGKKLPLLMNLGGFFGLLRDILRDILRECGRLVIDFGVQFCEPFCENRALARDECDDESEPRQASPSWQIFF